MVAVASHRFWRDRLGGDPDVVGSTLHLNRQTVTIIGVAKPKPVEICLESQRKERIGSASTGRKLTLDLAQETGALTFWQRVSHFREWANGLKGISIDLRGILVNHRFWIL